MNHAGEIGPLSRMVRPACRGHHHRRAGAYRVLRFASRPSPTPRPRSSRAEAGRCRRAQPRQCRSTSVWPIMPAATASPASSASAQQSGADIRLLDCKLQARAARSGVEILGRRIDYRLGAPGRHWVLNSLGVLAAVAALGADVGRAAGALAGLSAAQGPRRRRQISLRRRHAGADRRELQRQPGVDARGLRRAGARRAGSGRPAHRRAGRHARAGRPGAGACTPSSPPPCVAAGIDLVFTVRAADGSAAGARCRPSRRGAHAADSPALVPRRCSSALRPGDVVAGQGLARQPRWRDRRGATPGRGEAAAGPRARAANGR